MSKTANIVRFHGPWDQYILLVRRLADLSGVPCLAWTKPSKWTIRIERHPNLGRNTKKLPSCHWRDSRSDIVIWQFGDASLKLIWTPGNWFLIFIIFLHELRPLWKYRLSNVNVSSWNSKTTKQLTRYNYVMVMLSMKLKVNQSTRSTDTVFYFYFCESVSYFCNNQ